MTIADHRMPVSNFVTLTFDDDRGIEQDLFTRLRSDGNPHCPDSGLRERNTINQPSSIRLLNGIPLQSWSAWRWRLERKPHVFCREIRDRNEVGR